MKNIKTNSQRVFKIAFAETDTISMQKYTLDDLLNVADNGGDYEWKYAISEIIDTVLDLRRFDRMQFLYSRDNPNSFGLIVRIN